LTILPASWSSTSIANLCATAFDGPFGSNLKSADYSESGVRVVRLENIGHLHFWEQLRTFITRAKYRGLAKYTLLENDIVFSSFVDEDVRVCLIPKALGLAINKADCFCLRINRAKALPQFVAYRLATPDTYADFRAIVRGVTRPRINISHLKKYEIAAPPIPEQLRIVESLDSVVGSVDKCRARLDRVPQILKKFREAVLEAAVSGRLTEEWRSERGIKLTDWQDTSFEGASEYITVGHVGKMSSEYVETGIPFLRSLNVRPFKFDRANLRYISEKFHNSLAKSGLKPGDVVVVRTGTPGQCCVIPVELPKANCSDLVILRPLEMLNPHFACVYINSATSQRFVRSEQVGVAQLHFNVGSMKKVPLRLPSIEEQTEIVRRQDELFELADSLQRRYNETLSMVGKLTPSVLAKAFRGELVPLDPNDEPAGEMLEGMRSSGSSDGASTTKIRAAGGKRG
jgi:type I restriction enzyme S subunit